MNHRTTFVVVRALALVLASSAALLGACASDPSFTRIILVRHGEKAVDGTKDPDLSELGRARANRLAAMTHEAGVAALFASQFKRTQETVAPLAAATGLPVTAIDAGNPKALAHKILRDFGGKVVVVAAHSNTIPAIIAALGGPPLAELADDAYDELFVIVTDRREPGASGHTEVVHLRYAVTTTPAPNP